MPTSDDTWKAVVKQSRLATIGRLALTAAADSVSVAAVHTLTHTCRRSRGYHRLSFAPPSVSMVLTYPTCINSATSRFRETCRESTVAILATGFAMNIRWAVRVILFITICARLVLALVTGQPLLPALVVRAAAILAVLAATSQTAANATSHSTATRALSAMLVLPSTRVDDQ